MAQPKEAVLENHTTQVDSTEEYVNRSFVHSNQKPGGEYKKPFEFINQSSASMDISYGQTELKAMYESQIMGLQSELSDLRDAYKLLENAKLKSDKTLLQLQLDFDSEQRTRDGQYSKELKSKQREIDELEKKIESLEEGAQMKLE